MRMKIGRISLLALGVSLASSHAWAESTGSSAAVDLGEEAANRGDYGRSVRRVDQVETVAEAGKLDVSDFGARYRSQPRDERTRFCHGDDSIRAAMDDQERRR